MCDFGAGQSALNITTGYFPGLLIGNWLFKYTNYQLSVSIYQLPVFFSTRFSRFIVSFVGAPFSSQPRKA